MFIYKITNKNNGKIYIGKTELKNPIDRFKKHIDGLKYGYHPNKHFLAAFRKYGEDSFLFEIIEETTRDLIDSREIYFIELYQSFKREIGYNKTLGGDGLKANEEIRKKLSLANKGRKHSDKSKMNMSKAHLGCIPWNKGVRGVYSVKFSDEHRKNLSKSLKGRIPSCCSSNKGKKLTEDHRKKLSLAKIGKTTILKGRKRPGFKNSGNFKKGQKPWNYGIKTGPQSDDTKKKRSNSLKGRVFSKEHLEKIKETKAKKKALFGQNRDYEASLSKTEACSD